MSENAQEQPEKPEDVTYELTSTQDAARLLRVSESTVWRWIDQDILPAYRVGRKRVWLKRSDLEALIKPLQRTRKGKKPVSTKDMKMVGMREMTGATDVVARARTMQAAILARRGDAVMAEAWEDINAAREARSAEL